MESVLESLTRDTCLSSSRDMELSQSPSLASWVAGTTGIVRPAVSSNDTIRFVILKFGVERRVSFGDC